MNPATHHDPLKVKVKTSRQELAGRLGRQGGIRFRVIEINAKSCEYSDCKCRTVSSGHIQPGPHHA